jgi:hypothetical protein
MQIEYRGSDEDYQPTVEFVKAWWKKWGDEVQACYVALSDVNYETDKPDESGSREAHYKVAVYFGMVYSGDSTTTIQMVLPYNWTNPEGGQVEPGYLELELVVLGEQTIELSSKLLGWTDSLVFGYNHMLGTEYEGSRNELIPSNEDAVFSISIQ